MKDILNSHTIQYLKKEISKTNIKGYSKMKKAEIVNLMSKHSGKFKYIKHKSKPQKVQTKQDRLDEAEGKKKGKAKKSQSVTSRLHEAEGKKKAIKKTKAEAVKKMKAKSPSPPPGKVRDEDEVTLPFGDVDFASGRGVYQEDSHNLGKEAKKWSFNEKPNPNRGGYRNKDYYDRWKEESNYIETYTSRKDFIEKEWDRIHGQQEMRRATQGGRGDDDFWRYHAQHPGAFN